MSASSVTSAAAEQAGERDVLRRVGAREAHAVGDVPRRLAQRGVALLGDRRRGRRRAAAGAPRRPCSCPRRAISCSTAPGLGPHQRRRHQVGVGEQREAVVGRAGGEHHGGVDDQHQRTPCPRARPARATQSGGGSQPRLLPGRRQRQRGGGGDPLDLLAEQQQARAVATALAGGRRAPTGGRSRRRRRPASLPRKPSSLRTYTTPLCRDSIPETLAPSLVDGAARLKTGNRPAERPRLPLRVLRSAAVAFPWPGTLLLATLRVP